MAQYSIGQIEKITGVKPHVLRYWEEVIPSFTPRKEMSGRRIYSQKDLEIILRLKEEDFKDLAYTYLAYLSPIQFKRCFRCKKWIRNKNNSNELCKECREQQPEEKDMIKTGNCIDCGREFYVDVRNMTKCRCDECQHEENKRIKREWWNKNKGKV